jgi:putative oxidoreductase
MEAIMRSDGVMTAGAALLGRLLLAALFILEAWSKLKGHGAAVAYMERFSVPSTLLPAVIVLELGGGLLLAIGWKTRPSAAALAGFCILTALLFHANFADRNQLLHFEKDLAIAGGLLTLFAFGPGRYAIGQARSPLSYGEKEGRSVAAATRYRKILVQLMRTRVRVPFRRAAATNGKHGVSRSGC